MSGGHAIAPSGSALNEGIVVLFRHSALVAAAAVTLFALAPNHCLSREWKATPEALAREYATINDSRPGGDLILLLWFVPEMSPANAPGSNVVAAMLQRYVVIVAVHGRLERTSGSMSFEELDPLTARDQTGKPLVPVTRDELPPTNTAMLAGMEGLLRQSLGALGKGMKMFVFDGGAVSSCKQGQLSVPFADETYTWNTPIPGCAQK
jgi:hypothetical protein